MARVGVLHRCCKRLHIPVGDSPFQCPPCNLVLQTYHGPSPAIQAGAVVQLPPNAVALHAHCPVVQNVLPPPPEDLIGPSGMREFKYIADRYCPIRSVGYIIEYTHSCPDVRIKTSSRNFGRKVRADSALWRGKVMAVEPRIDGKYVDNSRLRVRWFDRSVIQDGQLLPTEDQVASHNASARVHAQ